MEKKLEPDIFTADEVIKIADQGPHGILGGILFSALAELEGKEVSECKQFELLLTINGKKVDFRNYVSHLESQWERCVNETAADKLRRAGHDFFFQIEQLASAIERKTKEYYG